MSLKTKFQEILVKYGGTWALNYVKKHRLEDDVVNSLIREKKDEFLLHYVQIHSLSTDQITEILQRDEVDELMLAVVRLYVLTSQQQEILIKKNNALLWEAYLCPKGFFVGNRRFATLPEYLFIYKVVKSEKPTGVELFKIYVDNTYKTLLTEDVVNLLIENENTWACKYIFHRARLRKEWEKDFILKVSDNMLKSYMNEHEFYSDDAQLTLVQQKFALAQSYYQNYGFRSKARQLYHDIRQQEIDRQKAEQQM